MLVSLAKSRRKSSHFVLVRSENSYNQLILNIINIIRFQMSGGLSLFFWCLIVLVYTSIF
ncbi:hypothetical protein A6J64_012820 [Yersinia enterocolitica]|nr:hypothetical protein A6J64_012820 [Yersinia enterocolitica]